MRPFADAALDIVGPLSDITRGAADLWPIRGVMQALFAAWLTNAVMRRLRGVAGLTGDVLSNIRGLRGGGSILGRIGNYLAGGPAGGGVRGATPANPLFVKEVSLGGKAPGGGPVPTGGKPPGGGPLGRVPGWVKGGGGLLAVAGGIYAISKAMDTAHKGRKDERFQDTLNDLVKRRDLSGLKELRAQLERTTNPDHWKEAAAVAENHVRKMNRQSIAPLARNFRDNWGHIRDDTRVTTKRINNLVDYHFRLIKATVGDDSEAAARAASKNFWAARGAIRDAIKRGAIDTEKGLAAIEKLWIKTMGMYGFSPRQARNMAEGQQYTGAREEGQSGINKAHGGLIQVGRPGQRGADNVPFNLGGVPSVVANGEQIAVFNHHQQRKFAEAYPGGLEGFFAGPQPRHGFAGGGIVPVPGFPGERANVSILDEIAAVSRRWPSLILTDAFGPGHDSPGHTVTGTAADFSGPDAAMDAAVRALVAAGYLVGYDGRFGSQNWPGHGPSYVTPNFHFHVEFGSKGGGAGALNIEEIQRQQMTDGLGLATTVGQRVLDLAVSAANKSINRAVMNSLAIPTAGGSSAGMGVAQLAAIWRQANGTFGDARLMAAIAMAESSGNPAANGPPDGRGLWQIEWPVWADALGHLGNPYNPLANARMAGEVLRRQGLGAWVVYNTGAYRQFMERGGLVDTMGRSQWERGGKIERPTLMTGEDGSKMPEFVIGTNPAYQKSNIEALAAAARALGIPQARKSKINTKKQNKKIRAGKGPNQIRSVKRYNELLDEESDKNREISIAEMRVKEPDTFLIEGKDPQTGEPTYAVDEGAVTKYKDQLAAVAKLYQDLVKDILRPMVETVGPNAMGALAKYIGARESSIADVKKSITKNKKLAKSKDKDTKQAAIKRLADDQRTLEDQIEKRDNAKTSRSDIREDLHDARYRLEEAKIGRDSAREDADATRIDQRVAEELASSRESATAEAPPSMATQQAMFDSERASILREFGGNAGAAFREGVYDAMGGGGGLQMNLAAAPSLLSAMATSVSSGITGALGSAGVDAVSGGVQAGAAMVSGSGSAAAVGAGATIDQSKTVQMTVNASFIEPAPDPHTFVKSLQFEANALI
jgi:hypothetical protein